MTRRLRVQWAPGDKVTARLVVPDGAGSRGVLLAHGAGAGQDHPWMSRVRSLLGAAGFATMTFNYPYTEAGRRNPDRLPRLLAAHRAAAERLAGYVDEVVLAGKSMGGRVGSHLAGDEGWAACALVYFGYPLVPMGKGEPRPTGHLRRIAAPQLFICGTRDRLSPPDLIGPMARSLPAAQRLVVEGGDHSLRVPRRTGRSDDEVLAEVVEAAAAFIRGV
jgi:predicted alpha/beta-hydrolase family hydrolase